MAAERDTAVPAHLQSIAFAPAFTYDAVQRSLHSDIFLFLFCFVLGSVGCDSIPQRQMISVVGLIKYVLRPHLRFSIVCR